MPNFYKLASGLAKKPRSFARRRLSHSDQALKNWWEKLVTTAEKEREVFKDMPAFKKRKISDPTQGIASREVRKPPTYGEPERPALREPVYDEEAVARANKPRKQKTPSATQYAALLERAALRMDSPNQTTTLLNRNQMREAFQLMGSEAPQTKVYSRLYEQIERGGALVDQPRDYPYVEAYMRHARAKKANPDKPQLFTKPYTSVPPAEVMSIGRSGRPGEVAPGIVHEQRVYRPVAGETADRTLSASRAVEAEKRREASMARQKFEKQAQTVQASAQAVTKQTTPGDEILKQGLLLDRMWKFVGGKRTYTGKAWEVYRRGSRGRVKPKDARDYFLRCGLRWLEDPDTFAKNSPREAKSLKEIWNRFNAEFGND